MEAIAEKTKKITRATLKSFIKKNQDNLFVLTEMDFDGMTDCVSNVKDTPRKVEVSEINFDNQNNFSIKGLWLVGDSRDWFQAFSDELFDGIEISNCCGRYKIATMKKGA